MKWLVWLFLLGVVVFVYGIFAAWAMQGSKWMYIGAGLMLLAPAIYGAYTLFALWAVFLHGGR